MANPRAADEFKQSLAKYVADVSRKVDLSQRSENELEAYLNRFIEDLQHDLDRFGKEGLAGTVRGQIGANFREVRIREDRVQRKVVSLLSRAEIEKLNTDSLRKLKKEFDLRIPGLLGRFGHAFDKFVGETNDEVSIDIDHKQDWLIQNVLVLLSGFRLGDLTVGETAELENHVQETLKEYGVG